jgi:hypothetical protein
VQKGGIGPDLTPSDMTDLKNALAQQSHKRSRFKTTKVGRWLVAYTDFFGHDKFPSEMLQHWFHMIDQLGLDGSRKTRNLAFEWGMGGKTNIMVTEKGR